MPCHYYFHTSVSIYMQFLLNAGPNGISEHCNFLLYTVHTEKCIVPHVCMLFQMGLPFEKSPIGKYFWIYRDTCWFNIIVLSRTVANTRITFFGLETIQKDIHFGDHQLYFSVCTFKVSEYQANRKHWFLITWYSSVFAIPLVFYFYEYCVSNVLVL